MIFFSALKRGFYADELEAEYRAANSWPDDLVQISDAQWAEFLGSAPDGKMLGSLAGLPAWVDKPSPAAETVLSFNQFLGRFTADEQHALATAAQSNPQIFLWMTLGAAANNVDLLAPLTKIGMDALVSANVITSDRETALLTP